MQKIISTLKPWHLLIALILINLSLSFFIGNDFGQAWDEPSYYLYGERSYEAYTLGLSGQPLIPERHIYFIDLRYYGPFYTAVGWKIANSLTSILKAWAYPDVWHLVNFGFFQISLIALYGLAKRFLNEWTSIGVVLLFSTQPLLFGHAFINPKDIPFMTFFLVSLALGLMLADGIEKHHASQTDLEPAPPPKSFSQLRLFTAILFALFVLTIVSKDVIASAIGWAVSSIYDAPPESFAGQIFSMLADQSSRLPVESYIHKAVAAHLDRWLIGIIFIGMTARTLFFGRENLTALPKPNLPLLFSVLTAGALLGLTTSIRLLGPFAGLLAAGYILVTSGKKSLPHLIYYFSIAAIITYLAWPFLWDQPTYHFIESLQVMGDFPFTGEVRFMGDNHAPANLPWTYIPILVSIQITEPVVLLSWLGFIALLFKYLKDKSIAPKNTILLFWLIAPVALQILLGASVYDNFRQFLFVLPPMFILAGMGWEALAERVKKQTGRVALFLLCAVPGVVGCVSLHPYQYIYYNSFVGGINGAEGNFETDYWLTSYRETTEYLNENAPANGRILAWGAGYNVRDFSRDDITVFDFNSEDELVGSFDYAVITTRFDNHLNLFKDAEVVYEVRKNGVLLAMVKKSVK